LKRFIKLSLKILLWVTATIIFLVLLIYFLIQIDPIQSFIRTKAITFLEKKIETKVEIKKLRIDLPKMIVLEGVYFEDQHQDTLLAGDMLKVDISLFKLLKNQIQVNKVELKGITARVHRTMPDSSFNFDYILKAFAKDDTVSSDTPSKMKFSIHKIILHQISVSFTDALTANDINLNIDHFEIRIDKFDLDNMKFSVPKILLDGLNARVLQSTPPTKQENIAEVKKNSKEQIVPELDIGTVDLSRINIEYQNDISQLKSSIDLSSLLLKVDLIDIKNQRIELKTIELKDTRAALALGKHQLEEVEANDALNETNIDQNNNWKLTVKNIDLSNNDLQFDNFNKPELTEGMDYAHIALAGVNLKANNLSYSSDTISGQISKASFSNKDGFVLNNLTTNFIYCQTGIVLENLNLETPGTTISDYISVGYPSLQSLANNPGTLRIDANLVNSSLRFKDVLTFVPKLKDVVPFKNNGGATMKISGKINGSLEKLNFDEFRLSGFETTQINVSGSITGLPEIDRTVFNINIHELSSGEADLKKLLSAEMIPETVQLPSKFSLSGNFNGGIDSFIANLDLKSDFGAMHLLADLKNIKQTGNESYNATIEFIDFNPGLLLKQDSTLGLMNGKAEVKGIGLDPKTMQAQFSTFFHSASVMGYNYHNIKLIGEIAHQDLQLNASIKDQHLQLGLDAIANFKYSYPAIKFTLDIDSLHLQQLHLSGSDLRLRGKIDADLASTNPDSLLGTIYASQLQITSEGKQHQMDSLIITALILDNQKEIRLQSDLLTASLKGQYYLTDMGNALKIHFNKYIQTGDSVQLLTTRPQDFTFELKTTSQPILQELIPKLTHLEPVVIKGSFNSEVDGLNIAGSIPKIVYAGMTLEHVNLLVKSNANALDYSISLDKMASESFKIHKINLSGKAENNQLATTLIIKDGDDKDKYILAGTLARVSDQFQFHLKQEGLVLNYETWSVERENYIQFGNTGFIASNFGFYAKDQKLSVSSEPQEANAPLVLQLTNFKISTLTSIIDSDKLLADGSITGKMVLSELKGNPVFDGELNIKSFTFRNDTLGDISLKINNKEANTFAANLIITGNENDIRLDGEYFVKPDNKSSFDLDLDIRNLYLPSLEGLSMDNLRNSSGNISGKLKITGTTSSPEVRGDLHFKQAAFNIARLNSYFTIQNEKVSFTSEGIHFDTFTLVDTVGNKAIVDGSVYTTNFIDYSFGLDVSSKNFKVLSSTKRDNKLFYGQVFLDSDLRIRGNIDSPEVDGSVRINKGTDLTVVIPQSAPGVVDREGIVEFLDMDEPKRLLTQEIGLDTLNTTSIRGMNILMNVEADSSAIFNIVIDEANGDFLNIQGEAQLTAGIDPGGKVNLTGTFDVTKGAYELSFNFLRRRFIIEKGSQIVWQGEPTTAEANVTAIYIANTAPYDLIESKLDEPPAALNRYKQKLPFEVTLNMKGELIRPVLTFDIILPNRNYNVARDVVDNVQYQLTQLRSQPSELNKQVFALLLLNRFVAENPFASGAGGGGIESMARNSVSKILSEQINQLAGNLIEGVDLNFDLVSSDDYTTGQLENRTDLNVGISKKLLNDQLKVSIGSNFELEGPRNANQNASNIAGNVALDYQLSRDGRYMLRAYRKNEYQGVAEGYLIETGVGFIITLDYTSFKELFSRKHEKEAKRLLEEERK